MPDITQLIEHDHREVGTLFQNFKETGDSALASKICDELDAHAGAEEKTFYPVVRDELPEGTKLASEAEDEHGEARQLIGRIRRTSDPEHVRELVNELEQVVRHHVDEEESEMLPRARSTLGEARLVEIGGEFESAKARAQG
ncbi:MAG: hemerythrin domain-containing protein [Acidimicrobiia bacterium]